MSEIKVNSIKGVGASTAAITVNNSDGTCTANLRSIGGGQLAGSRNLVINGNMKVHQRAQSVTGISSGYQTADRFYLRRTVSSTFNSNVTNGVLTCNSPSSSTGFDIRHGIEWDDIFYGKTMTLSFNATAAVGGVDVTVEVVDGSIANTAATTYAHLTGTTTDVQDLVVTPVSGNKYEVTVDIPADADVSFTPDMLRLRFGNAVSDASQSFALSNVQFEFGSVATEFEHRSYADELRRCQRYYAKYSSIGSNYAQFLVTSGYSTDTDSRGMFNFVVEMRVANPSFTYSGSSGNVTDFVDLGGKAINLFSISDAGTGKNTGIRCIFSGSNTSNGFSHVIRANNTANAFFAFDAEL